MTPTKCCPGSELGEAMFCTVEDVELRLQTTGLDDATVEALIADAQAVMEAEVGRPLESAPRTETFDGGPRTLWLTYTPVTSITSISEDGETLADADFLFKSNGRLIRVANGFRRHWATWKPQAITVSYVGGFVAEESESSSGSSSSSGVVDGEHALALAHLRSLCTDIVARAFRKGAEAAAVPASAAGPIQSVSLEGSDTVTYATGGVGLFRQFVYIEDNEKDELARYKNLPVGFA